MLDPLAVLQLTDLEPVVLGMEPQHLLSLLEQEDLEGARPPLSDNHTHAGHCRGCSGYH